MDQKTTCPRCRGEGKYPFWVRWSDGDGLTNRVCQLCQGKGTIPEKIGTYAEKIAEDRNKLEKELLGLRRHLALYFHFLENEDPPDPPFLGAPKPARGSEVWKEWLQKDAAIMPREKKTK